MQWYSNLKSKIHRLAEVWTLYILEDGKYVDVKDISYSELVSRLAVLGAKRPKVLS